MNIVNPLNLLFYFYWFIYKLGAYSMRQKDLFQVTELLNKEAAI